MSIETTACAKINLHLDVLNKRQDGYHNIFSLMAETDIHDLLKLEDFSIKNSYSGEISVRVLSKGGLNSGIIPGIPNEENLIVRAIKAYGRTTGVSGSITISIVKNIPAGAGLGGGSSNAAAALKMINSLSAELPLEKLIRIGAAVGADVPFCLVGGIAICEGTGDRIEKLGSKFHPWIVIVNDGIHVDTAAAYRSLKRGRHSPYDAEYHAKLREILKHGMSTGDSDELYRIFNNDLEKPVFSQYPELAGIKSRLRETGPRYCSMTGSGSSIIGLFDSKKDAEDVARSLSGHYRQVFLTGI